MTLIERIHFGDNKKRGRERRYRLLYGCRCELNNAIEFQLNYIQIIEALIVLLYSHSKNTET